MVDSSSDSSSSATSSFDQYSESSADENEGLEPYQYEPSESESQASSDSESADEENTTRLTSTSWCECGNCVIMPTVPECVCCCEIDRVTDKMEENATEIKCIIEHEGFEEVCLNLWVLQTAFQQYRQSHGSQIPVEDDEMHRKYRFIAYRQLTWWCWGWLGRNVRVCLPSCSVKKNHNAFPSNQYTGFKYPILRPS